MKACLARRGLRRANDEVMALLPAGKGLPAILLGHAGEGHALPEAASCRARRSRSRPAPDHDNGMPGCRQLGERGTAQGMRDWPRFIIQTPRLRRRQRRRRRSRPLRPWALTRTTRECWPLKPQRTHGSARLTLHVRLELYRDPESTKSWYIEVNYKRYSRKFSPPSGRCDT